VAGPTVVVGEGTPNDCLGQPVGVVQLHRGLRNCRNGVFVIHVKHYFAFAQLGVFPADQAFAHLVFVVLL